jgi:hypothetical protein
LELLNLFLKKNDYAGSGILAHLFSLESLRKLVVGCEYSNEIFRVFSKIQLCSSAIESLTIIKKPERPDKF